MNRLDGYFDDYFANGKHKDVIARMQQASKEHWRNVRLTRAEYKQAVKKLQKVYLLMKNKNLKEYQNDDINIYMNEDGHIIGKVDNLYVTTKNEDNKMLLEITGEAMPHKSNEYVKEDFEGVEISVLATFVSVRRTCMKLEIDDNGKFNFMTDKYGDKETIKNVYLSEIVLGRYKKGDSEERKNELADALETEMNKSLPVQIASKLEAMKAQKKESSNKR